MFEFLVELVVEFVIEIIFEFFSDLFMLRVHDPSKKRRLNPWLAGIGYIFLGAVCGGVSLLLFPRLFVKGEVSRLVNLAVTPVLAGGAMALVGAWRRKRKKAVIRLETFLYGYFFALSMALVRLAFGKAA